MISARMRRLQARQRPLPAASAWRRRGKRRAATLSISSSGSSAACGAGVSSASISSGGRPASRSAGAIGGDSTSTGHRSAVAASGALGSAMRLADYRAGASERGLLRRRLGFGARRGRRIGPPAVPRGRPCCGGFRHGLDRAAHRRQRLGCGNKLLAHADNSACQTVRQRTQRTRRPFGRRLATSTS